MNTPQPNFKPHRDSILLPIGVPSNTPYLIYNGQQTFVDRQHIDSRRNNKKIQNPVQNDYLQQHQLHQIQQQRMGYLPYEQQQINQIMEKKPMREQVGLDRNQDDAFFLFQQQAPNFYDNIPQDTRREHYNLNDPVRELMPGQSAIPSDKI